MIKTSYFAKYKKPNGVAITLYPPKWYDGPVYKDLAPTDKILDWFKGLPKEEQETPKTARIYEALYRRDVLAHLDVHKVANDLENKVLLCYETSDKFCHRHVVAKWLRENGYECRETEMDDQDLYLYYGKLYEMFGDKLQIIEE